MRSVLKTAVQQNKKLFVRFFVSLGVCIALFLTCCIFSVAVSAQEGNPETSIIEGGENGAEEGDIPVDVSGGNSALYELIGIDASEPIQVIILITLLSLAPSFMIMLTSFTRIIIVLSFLRNAMQTQSTPPNIVLTGIALFLTIFIMWPVFAEINDTAYAPYAAGEISTSEAIDRAGKPLKTFMLKQTSNDNMRFFMELQDYTLYTPESYGTDEQVEANLNDPEITLENYHEQLGFEIVIPAFIVSELTRAFQMGFMLFIPFLVVDLVVASTLMSMGMMMLPPAMISLPFKILLFVMVDGWQMIVGSLVTSFNL
ncbi:MAG: flagellar type III secretion system pore protein FliP [Oscillospiraceae bacterium]|nr:flagellar type III secretion system pore protein FliP [Oscillospiraceae bacterium]